MTNTLRRFVLAKMRIVNERLKSVAAIALFRFSVIRAPLIINTIAANAFIRMQD
jgi:hypothetical protein